MRTASSLLRLRGGPDSGRVGAIELFFDLVFAFAVTQLSHALPGRIARLAYTFLHVLIIAGIIVCAVADEIALVHPGHASGPAIAAIVGGPAIYVLGNALFKWVTNKRPLPPLSHVAGLVLLALLMFPALQHALTALQLSALTTGILVMVATWERKSLS